MKHTHIELNKVLEVVSKSTTWTNATNGKIVHLAEIDLDLLINNLKQLKKEQEKK